MDKVSVVIPFYNCQYIGEAIESVLAQTYENIEIIVVDDGSTTHLDKLEPYKSKIVYLHKENGGTATALNVGIGKATGKYFCWLSSDDCFKQNKIKKQIEYMQINNVRACYTACDTMGAGHHHIDDYFNKEYSTRVDFLRALIEKCFVHGCTVMLHMDIFHEYGPFDLRYRYTHDYEMWLRIAMQEEFHYIAEKLVKYRVHEEMGTVHHQKEIKQEVYTIKRHYRFKVQAEIMKLKRGGN